MSSGGSAQSNQSLYGVVTARDDWIGSHPGQVERFLRSLEEAREFSLAHPEETKAIAKKRLNLTDSYLEATWPDHQFTLSLDQSLLIAMNDEARWMIENNMTSSEVLPDFRNSISVQGLLAVNPPAVKYPVIQFMGLITQGMHNYKSAPLRREMLISRKTNQHAGFTRAQTLHNRHSLARGYRS